MNKTEDYASELTVRVDESVSTQNDSKGIEMTFQLDEFFQGLQLNGSKIVNLSKEEIAKSPFPGLRPFETSEYQLFKGRDGQAEELIRRLEKNCFLAVIGSSGTGKSSLVRAGLIPQLLGGYLYLAGNKWNIAICRPGKNPVENLAVALASAKSGSAEKEKFINDFNLINPLLKNSTYGLLEVNELLMAQAPTGDKPNLLVIVDQFEELFRFNRKDLGIKNIESHFVNLILKAAQNMRSQIYVIITMRSEFLGDCVKYRGLPEAINEGQYLVPQLSRSQIKEVIEGPIHLASREISSGLVELLVNEIEEGKLKENLDQLPILQHALMRTYQAAVSDGKENEIGYDHFRSVGGMEKALANHAESKFLELGSETEKENSKKQRIAKMIFQSLTDLSADQKGGRRPTELKNIYEIAQSVNASPAEVDEVVNHFRDTETSFIMPPINTKLYPNLMLDISHESLMRNWIRLNQWILEDVRYGELYKVLDERRRLKERGKDEWLRRGLLSEIILWKDNYPNNSAWAKKYVDTNTGLTKEDSYGKNMEFLRLSIANSKKRNWLVFGSIGIGVVGLLIGIMYYYYSEAKVRALPEARRQILALTNEDFFKSGLFKEQVRDGMIDKLISLKYDSKETDQYNRLLNELNTASSINMLASQNPNAALSKVKLSYDTSRETMLDTVFTRILNKQWFVSKKIESAQYVSTSKFVVANDKKHFAVPCSNMIMVFEISPKNISHTVNLMTDGKAESRQLAPTFCQDDYSISSLVFTDDNHVMAHVGEFIYVWNMYGNAKPRKIGLPDFEMTSKQSALSPNGKQFIAFEAEHIKIWNVLSTKPPGDLEIRTDLNTHFQNAFFSSDGKKVIIEKGRGYNESPVFSCIEVPSLKVLKLPPNTTFARFTPDGQFVLAKSNDDISLFDFEGKSKSNSLRLQNNQRVTDLRLSQDGKLLLVRTADNDLNITSFLYQNRIGEMNEPIFSLQKDAPPIKLMPNGVSNEAFFQDAYFLDHSSLLSLFNGQVVALRNFPPFTNPNNAFSVLGEIAPLSIPEKIEFGLVNPDTLTEKAELLAAASFFESKERGIDTAVDRVTLQKARAFYLKLISKTNSEGEKDEYYSGIGRIADSQVAIDSNYSAYVKSLRELVEGREDLLKSYPQNVDIRTNLSSNYGTYSWFCLFVKDYDGAIRWGNRGLELSPSSDWIYSNMALAYLLSGRKDEADKIYTKFKGKIFKSGSDANEMFKSDLETMVRIKVINEDDPEKKRVIGLLEGANKSSK